MTRVPRFLPVLLALALVCATASPLFAQAAKDAKLLLTVVDQSGAVLPNAEVSVIRAGDPAAKVIGPVKSNDKGLATLEGLTPGTYEIQAAFPGFETRTMKDVRVRAGENKQVAILAIQGLLDEITVGRDKQQAAADPKSTFGTAMTREQIEALSDDPDEMRRQIQDMAPDAIIRIDSFEGGQLPPKAQIKSIHITRDQFAAESHYAGAHFIDIITQPGMGPLRGGTNFRFRDRTLNASSPQTNFKGPEQSKNYGVNLGGSLIKDKSSFSLSVNGGNNYDAPTIVSQGPEGRRIETLPIRRQRDNMFMFGTFDYALTKDQTLRMNFNTERFTSTNNGIGQFDLPQRAFTTEDNSFTLRAQEAGPLGRRFFINTRLQVNYQKSDRFSEVELPTIRIVDAETRGGAQQRGATTSKAFNLISDLDYVRGIHSWRTGIDVSGTWYDSNVDSNYLGTYTFESIADFNAGRARSYTKRVGDPNISYNGIQAAVYLQDDIRVRKNLTLSPGIRYEAQNLIDDVNNFAPRFGVNWAPFKSGRTTIRASWGIFYDWFSTGIYEQTLRVDGFRQQEINIPNPGYPDPGTLTGIANGTNRYLLGDDVGLVRTNRLSAGISQTVTPRIRLSATYANSHMNGVHRGLNLNAPVSGARPDSQFANVIEVIGDGESESHSLSTSMNISFMAPGGGGMPAGMPIGMHMPMMMGGAPPARGSQPKRFDIRRGSLNLNWTLARTRNNSDGAFSTPFTGSPEGEWGPSNQDIRHRLNVGINSQALRNMNMFLSANYTSGAPYTIRTGVDDNGDLIFNDRPFGLGRNTERGDGMFNVSANASYTIQFGRRAGPPSGPGGGPTVIAGGDRIVMMSPGGPGAGRYRMTIGVGIQNLTNHVNHTGWIGTMTSDFFRQSTSVGQPRKIDLNVSFGF